MDKSTASVTEAEGASSGRDPLALYAWLLDSSIRLPGGFRIGLDAIIGLVPVVGDLISAALSGGIVLHAMRQGASAPVLLRMIGNVGVDFTFGAIPLVGDLFDAAFKANERNVRLMREHAEDPRKTKRRSAMVVAAAAGSLLGGLILLGIVLWQLLSMLVVAVSQV